jgi:nucleotide-binding universal stress UspA family protein
MPEVTKILFALEISGISPKLTPWVKYMVQKFQAELHVIHVVPDMGYWGVPYASDYMLEKDKEGLLNKAKAMADEFCLEHLGTEIKPVVHVVAGHPADEITKYAGASHADIIIMGTHGKRGLDRALFGSVADQVLRLSPVPVFCINPSRAKP